MGDFSLTRDDAGNIIRALRRPKDDVNPFDTMLREFGELGSGYATIDTGEQVRIPAVLPARPTTQMEKDAFKAEERARVGQQAYKHTMSEVWADMARQAGQDPRSIHMERSGPAFSRPAPERAFITPGIARLPGEVLGFGAAAKAPASALRSGAMRNASKATPSNDAPNISSIQKRALESPGFKQWFGKSKLVDDQGAPLVLYHGTNKSFDQFDPKKSGAATDQGWFGKGIYLTPRAKKANQYAQPRDESPIEDGFILDGGNVMPVFANLQNPKYAWSHDGYLNKKAFELEDGYDGVIVVDTLEAQQKLNMLSEDVRKTFTPEQIIELFGSGSINELVVRDPRSIKSALNKGAYDSADPRLLYSAGPATAGGVATQDEDLRRRMDAYLSKQR